MTKELTQRLQDLNREIDRQDEQWAVVERQIRALSSIGIAIARCVVDDIDQAFAPSRSPLLLHHKFC